MFSGHAQGSVGSLLQMFFTGSGGMGGSSYICDALRAGIIATHTFSPSLTEIYQSPAFPPTTFSHSSISSLHALLFWCVFMAAWLGKMSSRRPAVRNKQLRQWLVEWCIPVCLCSVRPIVLQAIDPSKTLIYWHSSDCVIADCFENYYGRCILRGQKQPLPWQKRAECVKQSHTAQVKLIWGAWASCCHAIYAYHTSYIMDHFILCLNWDFILCWRFAVLFL